MIEEKYLNHEKQKRTRVRGSGPHRAELPNFKFLGQLPQTIIDEALELIQNYNGNDLGSDRYKISSACPLIEKTGEHYRQMLIQRCKAGLDPNQEESYTEWIAEAQGTELKKILLKEFPHLYRLRVAVLHPGEVLDWHIDTDTSVSCRVSISCNKVQSAFEISRRGEVESCFFKPGEIWFTNTGWNHRVKNNDEKPRINLIFGIKHEHLAAKL